VSAVPLGWPGRCVSCGLACEARGDRWCQKCLAVRHAAFCDQPFGHDGPCDSWPWEPP
jgi:hypothetical protein